MTPQQITILKSLHVYQDFLDSKSDNKSERNATVFLSDEATVLNGESCILHSKANGIGKTKNLVLLLRDVTKQQYKSGIIRLREFNSKIGEGKEYPYSTPYNETVQSILGFTEMPVFTTWHALHNILLARMFETSETKKSEAFYKFQSIKTAKYLFIDDLNPKKSGMKIETQIQLWLKELFEHRFENSITKKTYITSNFSRDDFLNQDLCLLDQATVDRLIGSINNNFITSSETESKRY